MAVKITISSNIEGQDRRKVHHREIESIKGKSQQLPNIKIFETLSP